MNCTETRQHWMLYLDSEGDPELHLRIRDHIAECPACAKWFAEQHQVENRINDELSAGSASPDLWGRVLTKAGLRKPPAPRRRWPLVVGGLAAAMVMLAVVLVGLQMRGRSNTNELAQSAAEWHEQRMRGNVHPEFVSTSDLEVDRYLKAKVPFRVHCPPRTDVNFTVQGAGVCFMKDQRQAAYIVGHVGKAPVTILVLDRASLDGYPQGGFHHSREGTYQVASGVIANNVVVVIGTTTPDVLERLLNAYGSYHEG
jgi:Putative zinc-finger